jgi:hypothetical protein
MATDPVEILRQRNAEVEKIRGYADLTEEAKQRRIAEVNERARAAHSEAIEANEREREQRLEQTKQAVFRIPIPYSATDGEAAQIRSSYRTARTDVELALAPFWETDPGHTQEKLEGFLEQAELTQDPELARAAYHLAIKHGVQSVVDAYLSTRPQENKAWESYTTAQEEAGYASSIGGLLERGLAERALNTSPEGPGYPAAG